MQAKITKRLLDSLAVTERTYLFDTETKGFVAIVHPGGKISFAVDYRPGAGGRSAPKRRYKIGTLGKDMTVDEARKEAIRILGQVRDGADPAAERVNERTREKTTVESLVDTYVEIRLKPRLRTWKPVEAALRKALPEIGAIEIEALDRRAIARALDEAAKRGPIAGNRLYAYLQSFLRWAVERGHIEANPLAETRRPSAETSRERVLDDGELVEVWRAADAQGYPFGPLVKLLILSGQRRAEVAGMAWAEVENLDSDEPHWRIPPERVKNKREHLLALPPTAADILNSIPRTSGFVFTTTGHTPVSGFGRLKERLDKSIDAARQKAAAETSTEYRPMRAWTLHDIRRSVASGLARLGFAPSTIEAVLNHVSGVKSGIAGVYNRHSYQREIAAALVAWDAHLMAVLAGDESGGNVLKFARPPA